MDNELSLRKLELKELKRIADALEAYIKWTIPQNLIDEIQEK